MVRAATVDRNGLKKGAWSPEEDEKLRAYIQRYGSWNWRQLPKFAGLSRCGKSCRLRWMNYLRPGVKHGSFSEEEDRLISQLHKEVGNKWSRIALSLPGRTDNQIKNHWHTHLKKREKQDQTATESKGNPIETSESMSKTDRLGAESSVVDNDPPYFTTILESSAWSASDQETSGNVLSSSGVDDHAFMPDTNCLAEDGVASIRVDVFEESSSEFWTQPFVVDNACDQESYPFSGFSLTEEEGYILMCGASCYEAAEDLILGTMQEFP